MEGLEIEDHGAGGLDDSLSSLTTHAMGDANCESLCPFEYSAMFVERQLIYYRRGLWEIRPRCSEGCLNLKWKGI
jgi:hypothetical protein